MKSASWVDRLLLLPLERPWASLGLVLLITALLGAAVPRLEKDVRIEKVFPERSERRAAYTEFTELFGRDDETALALLEMPRSVLEVESLERIHELTEELRGLPLVDGARLVSLTNAAFVRVTGEDELEVGPLYEPSMRESWDTALHDRLLRDHPAFARRLISDDRRLAAFLVPLISMPEGQRTEGLRREFAGQVRGFFADRLQPDEKIHLDGFAITYDTVLGLLETDVGTFFSLSLLLLLVSLGAVFRRVLPTLLTVATMVTTVVWTLGSMALLGIPFNFISSCIPVMLLVVCVGDAVHLIARTHQYLRLGQEHREALAGAVREVGRACFFTSVTTAAGFLSLLTSQVEVVRELGAPVAFGVLYAYVVTFMVVPPVLAFFRPPERFGGVSLFAGPLERIAKLVRTRPRTVVVATLLLVGASAPAIPYVSRESRLLQDFDEDQPIMATRVFFEQRMGGVAPIELLIDAGPGRGLDPDVQQGVLDLARALRTEPFRERGVLFVLSVADFLSDAYHTWSQRSEATRATLPQDGAKLAQLRLLYELFADPDPTREFLDDPNDPRVVRLQMRVRNLYTTEFFALAEAVEAEAKKHLPEGTTVRVTGNTILSQSIHHTLVQDMLRSFAVAFGLIGVLVLLFFRSPKLALLGMLPNLLPLVLVMACMGLTGIALSLSTSIVFTIVFGISVDDTIHFVSAYAQNDREGAKPDPISATLRGTGLSLVLSSIVLVLGFSVLLLSQFKINRYFGLLVSQTVVFALLGDLFLLPALLWIARGRRRCQTASRGES